MKKHLQPSTSKEIEKTIKLLCQADNLMKYFEKDEEEELAHSAIVFAYKILIEKGKME